MSDSFILNEEYTKNGKNSLTFHEADEQPSRSIHEFQQLKKKKPCEDGLSTLQILTVILFGLIFQAVISMGGYSGQGKAPMFGDYEAQRHWMEITYHLPISEWYNNSTRNNLNYWGLDYPPLTAYHSYLMGVVAHNINPNWVKLLKSRGIETSTHKMFMRLSVIISNLIMYYIPVAFILSQRTKNSGPIHNVNYALLFVLFPGLLSIDYGHFQYNGISLGLFILSYYFFTKSSLLLGSIAYVCALNYKQMELYHSLPIFFFIIARSIVSIPLNIRGFSIDPYLSILNIWRVGWTVILTMATIWSPIASFSGHDGVIQVFIRMFPFERGLFEDKVANFWCSANILFKFNQMDKSIMVKLAGLMTLLTSIPSLYYLMRTSSNRNLRLSLFIVSLNFFLFSFQVHEKSILLAAIPCLLLIQDHPCLAFSFLHIANTSLFSLCIKDSNEIHFFLFFAYFVYMCILWPDKRWYTRVLFIIRGSISLILCISEVYLIPPSRLPYLFPQLSALYSFISFFIDLLCANYLMSPFYLKNNESKSKAD